LFVYAFGDADVSKEKAKTLAYCYSEDQCGKDGNNVVSLLMKAL
jgi:hypothetical protein